MEIYFYSDTNINVPFHVFETKQHYNCARCKYFNLRKVSKVECTS